MQEICGDYRLIYSCPTGQCEKSFLKPKFIPELWMDQRRGLGAHKGCCSGAYTQGTKDCSDDGAVLGKRTEGSGQTRVSRQARAVGVRERLGWRRGIYAGWSAFDWTVAA